MRKWLLLISLTAFLFANEADEGEYYEILPFDCSTQDVKKESRKPEFLAKTNYPISSKVHPYTGEYCEDEVDLIVAGAEPLSLRHFYNSFAPVDPLMQGWRLNPECFFFANLEYDPGTLFASIGERDGVIHLLQRSAQNTKLFTYQPPKNLLATTVDGKSHPLNIKVHFSRIDDPNQERRFQYVGTISDGSGRTRSFISPMHLWLERIVHVKWKRVLGIKKKSRTILMPHDWTPFHLPIVEERLPNGNLVCYTYCQGRKGSHGCPTPSLLQSITAYNHNKSVVLGFINIEYQRVGDRINSLRVTGSDGRVAHLHLHQDRFEVTAPNQSKIQYYYDNENKDYGLLKAITKPKGEILKTYYQEDGKVSTQYIPTGHKGAMELLHGYRYNGSSTEVIDRDNNTTVYHFNRDGCVTSIDNKFLYGNDITRSIHFTTDPATRNVTKKIITDGRGNQIQITEYKYDKNQNPIEEKVGLGQEWRVIKRTYSDDGLNLKLSESDRPDKKVCFHYFPGTNLLTAELTYEKERIRKRLFHSYDDCAICVQTIVDDGSSEDPNSLQGVTYRKITKITPRRVLPCFGLPEVVEEKTIDKKGKEILLHKVVYEYTTFGKTAKEIHYDAQGQHAYSLCYLYNEKEQLVSKVDQLGYITKYSYDENHNLISIIGPSEGEKQEITYDRADRPVSIKSVQKNGAQLVEERKYNTIGRLVEEIDSSKNKKRFEYDSLGNLVTIIHPDGAIERKRYDLLGNVIEEVDPCGMKTKRVYNKCNELIAVYYPDGSEEHFTYDEAGNIKTHLDKNGATTRYCYDLFDHPVKIEVYSQKGVLLKSTHATWSPFHKLSETEGDLTISYSYDYAGRKIAEKNGYKTIAYSYDSLGRVSKTHYGSYTEENEYDVSDQLIKTSYVYGSALLQKEIAYQYDPLGYCTHVIEEGRATITDYNSDGKPLSIKDGLGFQTAFTYTIVPRNSSTSTNPLHIKTYTLYDSCGRESTRLKQGPGNQIIQKSQTVYSLKGEPVECRHDVVSKGSSMMKTMTYRWEYGPLGRWERFIEADQKETRFFYDKRGRLEKIIKPGGITLCHEYDDLGRLVRHYAKDFDYRYVYDCHDRIVAVEEPLLGRSTRRSYDSLGNLLEENLAHGFALSYVYNEEGQRISCELPDSSSIDYEYEGIYMHSVTRKGYTHLYTSWNLNGELMEALSPIGKILYERDCLGRLIGIKTAYYLADSYQYDPMGNLISYRAKDGFGEGHFSYQYDELEQLKKENDIKYAYDSLYNRIQKGDDAYQINALCQVVHDGKRSYQYDERGNLIFDGVRRYHYDSLDRLVKIEEGDRMIEYSYDPFHRRLSKTMQGQGKKGKTVRYLWDGDHEIGSVNEEGKIVELRVLGQGLGAEVGAAVLYELGEKPYVPLHDHRGSVVMLIDIKERRAVASYRYSAFKEEEYEGLSSPWRFSSKRWDEESGLLYFGRRYYHPELGRWLTKDPKGIESGPNLYAYLHNCPMTEVDLYGLENSFTTVSRAAFSFIEWMGANMCAMPYMRHSVESIGRWGAGGEFRGESRYQTPHNEIITIPGHRSSQRSITHGNGMLTRREDAIKQAKLLSEAYGGCEVDLLYHGTRGFVYDLMGCCISKAGLITSYNKMCATYYQDRLKKDPDHQFISTAHSRGGIQLMNTSKLLSEDQCMNNISVITYGSATMIPRDVFKQATNIVTSADLIPMTNPITYFRGLAGKNCDITVIPSLTSSPLKAHSLLEKTYYNEIFEQGKLYKKQYFNYD